MKVLGIEFAPLKIPLHRRLETIAALYYCTSFLVVGILGIFLMLYLSFNSHYFLIAAAYMIWLAFDIDICNKGGRRINFMRRAFIWYYFRDYFPIRLIKTTDLDPNRNYLFGYHPHGIMAVGAFCNFATEATDFSKQFPGITAHLLILEGQFWFPLHRDLVLSTGSCAVSKQSIHHILTQKGVGNAAIIVVGGALEALEAHPGQCTLVLKRRKGFIKQAILHGADLVPVFSFGENDIYKQAENQEGTRLRKLQNRLTKALGFSPPLFSGRGIFQYNWGYLPFRRPINTVVGAPIRVKKNESPTREEVDELHQEYINALMKLFDDHKAEYGQKHVTMVFT